VYPLGDARPELPLLDGARLDVEGEGEEPEDGADERPRGRAVEPPALPDVSPPRV
jgi:hypothetical protein